MRLLKWCPSTPCHIPSVLLTGLALALLSPLGSSHGQVPGAAYVMFGKSTKPHPVGSVELLLKPLAGRKTAPVVTALASSPDGKFLAAAGDDHSIRVIDVFSGETKRTFVAHSDWIQALVFSNDGRYLYSAGNDGRVLRFSNERPMEPEEIAKLPFAVRTISIATENQLLAIAGFSNAVVLWDLAKEEMLFRLQCNCRDQRCVRFSPDGNQLLCGSRDGTVRVWRTSTGEQIAEYKEHQGEVQTAAFTADGKTVNSVGDDRQLVRYDLTTGEIRLKRELAASKLMSMCMINDDVVAVAGADNSVHLYDAVADEVVAHLKGHSGTVAVMTPCGSLLASGSFDTTIRIWDLDSIDAQQINYEKPVHAPINMDNRLRIR